MCRLACLPYLANIQDLQQRLAHRCGSAGETVDADRDMSLSSSRTVGTHCTRVCWIQPSIEHNHHMYENLMVAVIVYVHYIHSLQVFLCLSAFQSAKCFLVPELHSTLQLPVPQPGPKRRLSKPKLERKGCRVGCGTRALAIDIRVRGIRRQPLVDSHMQ